MRTIDEVDRMMATIWQSMPDALKGKVLTSLNTAPYMTTDGAEHGAPLVGLTHSEIAAIRGLSDPPESYVDGFNTSIFFYQFEATPCLDIRYYVTRRVINREPYPEAATSDDEGIDAAIKRMSDTLWKLIEAKSRSGAPHVNLSGYLAEEMSNFPCFGRKPAANGFVRFDLTAVAARFVVPRPKISDRY